MIQKERSELLKENGADNKFKISMIDMLLHQPNIKPDDLAAINCPVLVMAGSKDIIKDEHTRLIASKIRNSKLVIFDHGTHFEPIENTERFNKTVIGFFDAR
jgi:pimeloyl-ACP methyl ester carboxylesterase